LNSIRVHATGGIEVLRHEQAPDPELLASEDVTVRIVAAGVNRIDLGLRAGETCRPRNFPAILGADGAGTIAALGSQAHGLNIGDRVCFYPVRGCGACRFCADAREWLCPRTELLGAGEPGTYAEYIRVPARDCFVIPRALSFEEAAALPLCHMTAWRMLIVDAAVKPGEFVLIVGAGGGIATAALQLAQAVGACTVIVTANPEKLAKAKAAGADHVLDCAPDEFSRAVRQATSKHGADVAINAVGGETWTESLAALARGGRLVTCGAIAGPYPRTNLRRIFWNHLQVRATRTATRSQFAQMLQFFGLEGRRPIIDRVFSLRDAGAAHQRLERRQQFGKILLRIDG
jgi:NADPH:quinone reductase-like Zn-dependent oxidoreductase